MSCELDGVFVLKSAEEYLSCEGMPDTPSLDFVVALETQLMSVVWTEQYPCSWRGCIFTPNEGEDFYRIDELPIENQTELRLRMLALVLDQEIQRDDSIKRYVDSMVDGGRKRPSQQEHGD